MRGSGTQRHHQRRIRRKTKRQNGHPWEEEEEEEEEELSKSRRGNSVKRAGSRIQGRSDRGCGVRDER